MKKTTVSRNNFISMLIEGGFYFTGYTFFDVYVVLPVFVEAITGDLKLAGLAAAIKLSLFAIPQLFMGLYTKGIKNVPRFLGLSGFLGRVSFFIVPIILILGANPYLTVAALYFALAASSFANGLTHVPWLDILGRTIKPDKRGQLLGYQQLAGGIGGFLAGLFIKKMLAGEGTLESKYTYVFLTGAVIISISGALLFTLKDKKRKLNTNHEGMLKYFKDLRKYLGNKIYTRFMTTQVLANFSGLAAPLYVVFAKNHFSLNADMVSTLMFIQITGSLFAGILWGNLSQKKGNRFTIRTSLLINLATLFIALILFFSGLNNPVPLLIIMVFLAGLLLGVWLGYTNYLLEIVDEDRRPVYIALTSTILFPLTFTSFIGGAIAEKAGFAAVFGITAVFITVAFIMSFKLENV